MSATIPWLEDTMPLPPATMAFDEHGGIVAATECISPLRLAEAYPRGIFPWYSAGEPVLWFSPEPRAVLKTAEFKAHRSLKQRRKQWQAAGNVQVRIDLATPRVMEYCATRVEGTWISAELKAAYLAWRTAQGEPAVHSVETWIDNELVGGFYGVALGRMFYGESMFSRVTDASKIALLCFSEWLQVQGVDWIDCQQATEHLMSLGARTMRRTDFLAGVAQRASLPPTNWLEARQLNLL